MLHTTSYQRCAVYGRRHRLILGNVNRAVEPKGFACCVCEYCYCREERDCPHDDPASFSYVIQAKENAPELLRRPLRNRSHSRSKSACRAGGLPAPLPLRLTPPCQKARFVVKGTCPVYCGAGSMTMHEPQQDEPFTSCPSEGGSISAGKRSGKTCHPAATNGCNRSTYFRCRRTDAWAAVACHDRKQRCVLHNHHLYDSNLTN